MPKCQKCYEIFPNRIKIAGKTTTLHRRKYCLNCSPFGKKNNRKLHLTPITEKTCAKCKQHKPIYDFYPRNRIGKFASYCKSCSIQEITNRQHKLKIEAVAYKGGKCQLCGYSKCISALEFHHADPSKKDFAISRSRNLKFEKIKKELDKCILVCSNCHREIHAGIITIKISPAGVEPATFQLR